MATNSPASQEVLEKLQQMEGKPDQQTVLRIIEDLEQHQFFAAPQIETIEAQLKIREQIQGVMESAHIEFMDEEVTGRLEALRDHLSAEGPSQMEKLPSDTEEPEWAWGETSDETGKEWNKEFEDERPGKTPETTPDYTEVCYTVLEDFLEPDENQPAFKKLATEIIRQYTKTGRSFDKLADDLQTYLDKSIYQQAEVLEADTPELKQVLKESRDWNEKKTREEVHRRKVQMEENKKEKERLTQKLKYVDEDIRSLQEDIKGLPEGVKPEKEQIDRLMELRTGKDGQQKLRDQLNEIEEKTTALNKELSMITHGTRARLKRSRKVSAETMVMHLHGFFIEKGEPDIDPIQKTDLAMERSEKSLRKMKVKRGFAGRKLKYRMEASYTEIMEFLASEKTPLSDLPEKVKKMVPKLKEIGKGDANGLKLWINELARQFEAGESKEKTKETLVKIISNIQGIIDEKRFFKAGVSLHTAKSLGKLNQSLKNAYREHLADEIKKEMRRGKSKLSKEENMNQLLQEINNFNLDLMEAREDIAPDMPEELKAFLKEHRKAYLSHRTGRALVAGAWNLTRGFGKGGKFGLRKLWGFTRKHPKGTAKSSAFLAACIFLGAWPTTSLTVVGWGSKKIIQRLWQRRQRKRGLAPGLA